VNADWGAEARVDALNAAGGIDGHPIKLVIKDDGSTPSGNATAAQLEVQQDHVFAIINDSSLAFASARYLNQQGIPVLGSAVDGPEWATPPNSNMFSAIAVTTGAVAGKYWGYANEAPFLKSVGVTSVAGVGANFPSVVAALTGLFQQSKAVGISTCYDNSTLSLGATDFTSIVLQLKSQKCGAVWLGSELGSSIALAQAIKNAGLSMVQFYTAAYDQNLLNQPSALAAMAGTYTSTDYNTTTPGPAASLMLQRLKQYTGFTGQIPSQNIFYSYVDADLLAMGLQMAGPGASRQAVIAQLRTVDNYTAGGLMATAVSFQHFATPQSFVPTGCSYIFKIEPNGYQPTNGGQPWCGSLYSVNT
jgi:ABC-type branched-subunit amino acid transport system substrate-binding protein